MRATRALRRDLLTVLAVGLVAVIGVGCDAQLAPEVEVAGQYEAETFEVDEGAGPVDVLSAGGRLDLALGEDGQFDGRLAVPGSLTEDGAPLDATFDGTFSVSGDRVRFFHGEDLFVRDVTWAYREGTLRTGDEIAGVAGFTVVLRRRP